MQFNTSESQQTSIHSALCENSINVNLALRYFKEVIKMENDEKHLSLVSGPPKTFNVVQILKLLLKKSRYENIDNTNTNEKGEPVSFHDLKF